MARRLKNKTRENLESSFAQLYGSGDYENQIRGLIGKRNQILYAVAILLALVFISNTLQEQQDMKMYRFSEDGSVAEVRRPESGDRPSRIPLIATAGESGKIPLGLEVPPQDRVEEDLDAESRGGAEALNHDRFALEKLAYSLSKNTHGKWMRLPDKLEDGTPIHWEAGRNMGNLPILILVLALVPAIWSYPQNSINKAKKTARCSIIRELPGFVSKMMLLMDAGLVMESAMKKIVDERVIGEGQDTGYFYIQLRKASENCAKANYPFRIGLREFAIRTGVIEFVRLSNIINDSTRKGIDIMGQLQTERDALWFARKKLAEEQGRVAETKLTLPLMILLLVLVMITIAPAMLKM